MRLADKHVVVLRRWAEERGLQKAGLGAALRDMLDVLAECCHRAWNSPRAAVEHASGAVPASSVTTSTHLFREPARAKLDLPCLNVGHDTTWDPRA